MGALWVVAVIPVTTTPSHMLTSRRLLGMTGLPNGKVLGDHNDILQDHRERKQEQNEADIFYIGAMLAYDHQFRDGQKDNLNLCKESKEDPTRRFRIC